MSNAESLYEKYGNLVDPADLDDDVSDAADSIASGVNNSGLDEQIKFLVEQIGAAETEKLLKSRAKGELKC